MPKKQSEQQSKKGVTPEGLLKYLSHHLCITNAENKSVKSNNYSRLSRLVNNTVKSYNSLGRIKYGDRLNDGGYVNYLSNVITSPKFPKGVSISVLDSFLIGVLLDINDLFDVTTNVIGWLDNSDTIFKPDIIHGDVIVDLEGDAVPYVTLSSVNIPHTFGFRVGSSIFDTVIFKMESLLMSYGPVCSPDIYTSLTNGWDYNMESIEKCGYMSTNASSFDIRTQIINKSNITDFAKLFIKNGKLGIKSNWIYNEKVMTKAVEYLRTHSFDSASDILFHMYAYHIIGILSESNTVKDNDELTTHVIYDILSIIITSLFIINIQSLYLFDKDDGINKIKYCVTDLLKQPGYRILRSYSISLIELLINTQHDDKTYSPINAIRSLINSLLTNKNGKTSQSQSQSKSKKKSNTSNKAKKSKKSDNNTEMDEFAKLVQSAPAIDFSEQVHTSSSTSEEARV